MGNLLAGKGRQYPVDGTISDLAAIGKGSEPRHAFKSRGGLCRRPRGDAQAEGERRSHEKRHLVISVSVRPPGPQGDFPLKLMRISAEEIRVEAGT